MTKILAWLLLLWWAAAALSAPAQGATGFPKKPVRLIVGVPPGGAADFIARIVGQKLTDTLGENVVVENRGGAGGTIASDIVAKANADGYSLLLSSTTTHGVGPVLYAKLPYDALKDFTHIGQLANLPLILVVHTAVAAKSPQELVELAKARPGALNFASSSSGSLPHLAGELFKFRTGAAITHVPYKGSGPAVVDLAAGQVQIMFDAVPSLYGQIKAGRLRVLAAVYSRRSSVFPEAPTLAEAGYPGIEGVLWFGASGPAGIPKDVVARINGEINKLLALPDVIERFASQGAVPAPGTSQQYTAFVKSEMAKWGPVVKASGAKVD